MSIIPFIGPKLENLFLTIDRGIDHLDQSLLMQSLKHRMSALKFLQLDSLGFAHPISTSLSALISSLPNLTYLKLPPFYLTRDVVTAVAQLRHLTRLSYSKWTNTAETYHESGMCFEFMPGSFPRLDRLSVASLSNRMAEILQSKEHLRRLRTVFLDCPAYNSAQEIENAFATLGSGAQHLEDVQLVCCPIPQLAVSSSDESLSVDTIRPLFSCTQLRRFSLLAPHLAPLKDKDVVDMGKSWPEMCYLILCPTPLVKRDLGTDFSILSSFAKSFPDLWELRLFFGNDIPEFDGDLYPVDQFEELETLGVGFSAVPSGGAQEIGFFLASLCRFPPLIEYGSTECHRGDGIPEEQRGELLAGWDDVGSARDLAFRIKRSSACKLCTPASDSESG